KEVIKVIRAEVSNAYDRTLNILRSRIDRFGVAQPSIQPIAATGRIMVELPGIKEPERVRKLLQGTAELEFWETYKFNEISQYFGEANSKLAKIVGQSDAKQKIEAAKEEKSTEKKEESSSKDQTTEEETTSDLLKQIEESDTTATDQDASFAEYAKKNPLYAYLHPSFYQDKSGQYYAAQRAEVGYAAVQDTARINSMLKKVKNVFPRDLKLAWMVKPDPSRPDVVELIALKITTRDGSAPLGGGVVTNARQDYDANGKAEISMSMNSEGARIWKHLTANNINRQIAIVLDGYVYSAPNVNNEIPNGRSSISGNYSLKEAKDLANILEAGKLPAPAHIVQEAVVGPSLGHEAITSGLYSFIFAFIAILLFMILYYSRAGWVSNFALLTNMFFLFGVLASLGAVLTLPGIAGIILTLGMAVDANVIIYERIREEVRSGKGIQLAITDGYKNAYSAIIDGNITTLLVGIVLYIFGSGPVQGFATTLIIGILSSLFTAILISRIIFIWLLDKNKTVSFGNKVTLNAFSKINIKFIEKRKIFYALSGIIIAIGLTSLFTKGLNEGVDFAGGRSYVVRFDQKVNPDDIRADLAKVFEESPEVKTFGPDKQVKITTKYLINDESIDSDDKVETKLYEGLKGSFKNSITKEQFLSDSDGKLIGKLSSAKVGPTIADDLLKKSYMALSFALVMIFLYIAARFRKWQFGVGGLVTLAHDSLIAISMYSIFSGVLPFSLEIDQSTIAAILTIIGYSINDSVIIFDRIREYIGLHPKRDLKDNINSAVNSTLGRTFVTSGTTLLVLLAIFIFGGEIIRGFIFALIIGVIVGTYSSIFISTPVAYDLTKNKIPDTIKK
ncbi:MAG: protein translocase subunit SecDF, partial [Bacteroidota bacterium]|nr:protein translocase subunit SecDF [Bacteroidota bacterium]